MVVAVGGAASTVLAPGVAAARMAKAEKTMVWRSMFERGW